MPDADGQAGAGRAKLRGAAPVNDELEVGFDQSFETRWHRWEIAGRSVLAIVVALGLAGLLGSGPFSHRTIHFQTGAVAAVDFEPIVRFGTPTQVTFHIRAGTGSATPAGRSVKLSLGTVFVEPFGLQKTNPASPAVSAEGGDLRMDILTRDEGKEALVRVLGQPSRIGPLHLNAWVGDEPPVRWTQLVLP